MPDNETPFQQPPFDGDGTVPLDPAQPPVEASPVEPSAPGGPSTTPEPTPSLSTAPEASPDAVPPLKEPEIPAATTSPREEVATTTTTPSLFEGPTGAAKESSPSFKPPVTDTAKEETNAAGAETVPAKLHVDDWERGRGPLVDRDQELIAGFANDIAKNGPPADRPKGFWSKVRSMFGGNKKPGN